MIIVSEYVSCYYEPRMMITSMITRLAMTILGIYIYIYTLFFL